MTTPEDPHRIVYVGQHHRGPFNASQREADGRPSWVRVCRGAYYPRQLWDELDARARHALLVHAAVPQWREPAGVLSHWSAAALWGLPVIGRWPTRVHVTMRDKPRSSQSGIQVHETFDPPEPVALGRFLVTSVARTVIDLARIRPLTQSLATADAALNLKLTNREALERIARTLPPGFRGRQMAGLVVDLADGLAESPLESLSRAVMFEEGFPRPQLQVPLVDDSGMFGRGDFGWGGLIGECDGRMKYGSDFAADPVQAIWSEKQREDRVRLMSDMVRWGWNDAYHRDGLCRKLQAKGLRTMSQLSWVA